MIQGHNSKTSRREDDFWGGTTLSPADELREKPNNGKPYDLEERTAQFGEAIICFVKKIPQNPVNNRLIGQLVGAGTSIGANYCEADDAVSRKDFKNRIGTCKKEAKETKFFFADGGGGRRKTRTGSPGALARSEGVASYFLHHLRKMKTPEPKYPGSLTHCNSPYWVLGSLGVWVLEAR